MSIILSVILCIVLLFCLSVYHTIYCYFVLSFYYVCLSVLSSYLSHYLMFLRMMLITDNSELTSNKMSLISILLFSVCLMPVVSCWYRKWLPVHWPRICWDPLWETWCLPKHPQYHYMMHSYLWIILWCMFCLQDCYILDQGGSSVMVWKGKSASDEERHSALSRAVVSICSHSIILQSSIFI